MKRSRLSRESEQQLFDLMRKPFADDPRNHWCECREWGAYSIDFGKTWRCRPCLERHEAESRVGERRAG